MPGVSSRPSSGCTRRTISRERASASPPCSASCAATAGRSGRTRRPASAPPSISRSSGMLMRRPLRVLLVEDNEDDAVLLLRELRQGNFEPYVVRVQAPAALKAELLARPWDVVISDFSLPSFSGLEALSVLRETGIDLPFILVSGTIGEEVAVEAMRAGADDYVMKAQLQRLPLAVERELREAEARAAHRDAEKTLIALRKAVDSLPVGVTITGTDGMILFTNPAEHTLHGYEPNELVGREGRGLVPAEFSRPLTIEQMRNLRSWK